MAEVYELPIEGYQQPIVPQASMYDLPIAQPIPVQIPRVVINTAPEPIIDDTVLDEGTGKKLKPVSHNPFEKLLGLNGAERYQLWPEKIVREAISAGHDVMKEGTLPPGLRREDFTDIPAPDVPTQDSTWLGKVTGLAPVASSPTDPLIEKVQAMAALAGTGGLAGVGSEAGVSLGATPFLRPALKHKDRLYKGKPGQEHQDIIPDSLYNDFQKKAMSGEDLAEYNFGFINEKGQFLTREKALEHRINTGLIDPSAGKYGALTTTLLADSSKPGTAIEAMAKTAQPFYSAVEHQVSQIPQAKMTGDQWLGTLSNKPGVKPEELDWTGLKGFLEENKGKPVTKAQIEEHLASNKVELKEVNKGGEAGTKDRAFELAKEHGWKSWDEIDAATQAKYMQRASKEAGESPTKYHGYQLPGGENYREMLLTLPEKARNAPEFKVVKHPDREGFALQDKKGNYKLAPEGYKNEGKPLLWETEALARDAGIPVYNKDTANYKSSHWDEPNILAHVRMNDRTIDGKKSLHLEEIQSDWHQQGRDKGYQNPLPKKDIPAAIERLHVIEKEMDTLYKQGKHELNPDAEVMQVHPEYKKLEDEKRTLLRRIRPDSSEVPDAPFKKSWHELALKRMIREAAEKGYDRLSWTPGEAQAARYDLSKQIKGLEYFPEKRALDMIDKNGNRQTTHDMTPEKLPDFVGKEAAKKLLETEGNKKYKDFDIYGPKHELYGVDLKIGGEGMKGFYDQIIPKALEKLGKEHGVKVKKHEPKKVEASPEEINKLARTLYETYDRKGGEPSWEKLHVNKQQHYLNTAKEKSYLVDNPEHPVYYIDIPTSLKDHAMGKGFPLFSKGVPLPLMPVEGNPFEDKKK